MNLNCNINRNTDLFILDNIVYKHLGIKRIYDTPNKSSKELATEFLGLASNRFIHSNRVAEKMSPCNTDIGYFHDIGYSDCLLNTGFHPLDGFIWLFEHCYSWDILFPVMYHSLAKEEVIERSLEYLTFYEELEKYHSSLDVCRILEISYWDIRTGPRGEDLSVEERISEILTRYDESSVVHRHILKQREKLLSIDLCSNFGSE